jgi:hypothetical protein
MVEASIYLSYHLATGKRDGDIDTMEFFTIYQQIDFD